MITNYIETSLGELQNEMYTQLNRYAKYHSIKGRVWAIPVAVIDVVLQTAKTPLQVIENVVGIPLNLIGATFSNLFTVKEAISNLESAATNIPKMIVVVGMSPVKLIYQLFRAIVDPAHADSISYYSKKNVPSHFFMYPQPS